MPCLGFWTIMKNNEQWFTSTILSPPHTQTHSLTHIYKLIYSSSFLGISLCSCPPCPCLMYPRPLWSPLPYNTLLPIHTEMTSVLSAPSLLVCWGNWRTLVDGLFFLIEWVLHLVLSGKNLTGILILFCSSYLWGDYKCVLCLIISWIQTLHSHWMYKIGLQTQFRWFVIVNKGKGGGVIMQEVAECSWWKAKHLHCLTASHHHLDGTQETKTN